LLDVCNFNLITMLHLNLQWNVKNIKSVWPKNKWQVCPNQGSGEPFGTFECLYGVPCDFQTNAQETMFFIVWYLLLYSQCSLWGNPKFWKISDLKVTHLKQNFWLIFSFNIYNCILGLTFKKLLFCIIKLCILHTRKLTKLKSKM
jgi:hypothetical protein